MGEKGKKTKEIILKNANLLFASKGFKNVTMQNICEATKLSRGGLYRHYDNIEQLFIGVLEQLGIEQKNIFDRKIEQGTSAKIILEETLVRMEKEMQDSSSSLSFAIYEFTKQCSHTYMQQMNERASTYWLELIEYGIKQGEFKKVEVGEAVDIILYSYQGVRMWSQVIELKESVAENITNHIRKLLEVDYE